MATSSASCARSRRRSSPTAEPPASGRLDEPINCPLDDPSLTILWRRPACSYHRPMSRILVTGMSGAGKSTLLRGLARRGHPVLDTDHDDWVLPDGRWDEARISDLLGRATNIVIQGTVENQGKFYDRFDHIVLLSASLETLIERVATRTSNPYGKRSEERAEIAHYVETVEPLLRRGATVELDGRTDPALLVDAVEMLIADR